MWLPFVFHSMAETVLETEAEALAARNVIKGTYSNKNTPILTIQDAIRLNSWQPKPDTLVKKGDAQGN